MSNTIPGDGDGDEAGGGVGGHEMETSEELCPSSSELEHPFLFSSPM